MIERLVARLDPYYGRILAGTIVAVVVLVVLVAVVR